MRLETISKEEHRCKDTNQLHDIKLRIRDSTFSLCV